MRTSGIPDDEIGNGCGESPPPATESLRLLDGLREGIIRGDYPPGTRLRERDLAVEFQTSRMPVREALPQLESEGFVITHPRRGTVVTRLTLRDAVELFEVRLGIEVLATRQAANRVAAGASTDGLRAAMARSEEATVGGDPREVALRSVALHAEIIALAGNSLLSSMMRTVAMRDRWISQIAKDAKPSIACEEHHRLCDAIYAGDGDLASSLAYAHIARARGEQLAVLRTVLPS
ncbi:GntR family transcriptional regulator [Pseudofrankia inefficax]|uniref:Transcriptional regulator, GntR family n=1 Tax=Pseudofrankia inefficax (strain DSM 45817 / CECT 9037 / DDB 130130 / EuI1c) TaxID=298654 RepID=E3JD32_PSEI1|nr:GntR family transcriptional regulator [Pseudofrankia inefficax]ADP81171.1 transcriptional regulator, GntR family [Pseudofrankia inefficax]